MYIRIGEHIKQAREERGWTQAQLGEALGYSQATIGNYELGRRHIGLDDLYRIADALNKPYAYFLGVDKQIEEETKRELEQKVRRDMADFVGVRMLPVISKPVPHDAPLEATDIDTKMPVARELAPGADLVFRVTDPQGPSLLSKGDYVFLSRAASLAPGRVWVLHAGGQADLYRLDGSGKYQPLLAGEDKPSTPATVLGGFCGLYTADLPVATQTKPAESSPSVWADLDQADQQQVIQFVDFLRARKGSQPR